MLVMQGCRVPDNAELYGVVPCAPFSHSFAATWPWTAVRNLAFEGDSAICDKYEARSLRSTAASVIISMEAVVLALRNMP